MTQTASRPRPGTDTLERELERELALHPRFGEPDYIRRRAVDVHGWTLSLLAPEILEESPALKREADAGGRAAYTFVADAIVREHLRHLWIAAKGDGGAEATPLADLVSQAARGFAPETPSGVLGAATPHLGRDGRGPWIWTGAEAPAAQKAFEEICRRGFPRLAFELLPATPENIERIRAAADLLRALLPALAPSVLAHVHGIALVQRAGPGDGGPEEEELFVSASTDSIPGIVFLSRPALADPHLLAESLLHEAAHNKLYDLWTCFPFFAAGAGGATRVEIPWARSSGWDAGDWYLSRVLAAEHVYVHLMAFFGAVLAAGDGGAAHAAAPDLREIESCRRTVREKAGYLLGPLRCAAPEELREAGRETVEWLAGLVEREPM